MQGMVTLCTVLYMYWFTGSDGSVPQCPAFLERWKSVSSESLSGECIGLLVDHQSPDREVRGSDPLVKSYV